MIDVATLREMIERAIELTRFHAIWWELVNKDNFDRYEKAINDHEDFFAATTHALFQGIAVIVYQLFETRDDSKSISNVINVLEETNPDLAQQLNAEINSHKPLLGKFFAIRNKVYAHRDKKKAPETVYNEASLKPSEMHTVVTFVRGIISSLAKESGAASIADLQEVFRLREKYSRDDTHLVLQAVEKHAL